MAVISRDELTDKIIRNDRICLKHFISGRPAYLYNTVNPDWQPTLNLGHFKSTSKRSSTANARYLRAKRRKVCTTEATEAAQSLLLLSGSNEQDQEQEQQEQDYMDVAIQTSCSTSNVAVQTVLTSEDMLRAWSLNLKVLKCLQKTTSPLGMMPLLSFTQVFLIFMCLKLFLTLSYRPLQEPTN